MNLAQLGIPHWLGSFVVGLTMEFPAKQKEKLEREFATRVQLKPNLERLKTRLQIEVLKNRPIDSRQYPQAQKDLDLVINLLERRLAGDEPSQNEWWSAGINAGLGFYGAATNKVLYEAVSVTKWGDDFFSLVPHHIYSLEGGVRFRKPMYLKIFNRLLELLEEEKCKKTTASIRR